MPVVPAGTRRQTLRPPARSTTRSELPARRPRPIRTRTAEGPWRKRRQRKSACLGPYDSSHGGPGYGERYPNTVAHLRIHVRVSRSLRPRSRPGPRPISAGDRPERRPSARAIASTKWLLPASLVDEIAADRSTAVSSSPSENARAAVRRTEAAVRRTDAAVRQAATDGRPIVTRVRPVAGNSADGDAS